MSDDSVERDCDELEALVGSLNLAKRERQAVFELMGDVDAMATGLLERRYPKIQGMRFGVVLSAVYAACLKLNEAGIAEANRKCGGS